MYYTGYDSIELHVLWQFVKFSSNIIYYTKRLVHNYMYIVCTLYIYMYKGIL